MIRDYDWYKCDKCGSHAFGDDYLCRSCRDQLEAEIQEAHEAIRMQVCPTCHESKDPKEWGFTMCRHCEVSWTDDPRHYKTNGVY